MADFVFDRDIFTAKFIKGGGFKNYAKSVVQTCDSVCPINSDESNTFKGYKSSGLLSDTIHYIQGKVISDDLTDSVNEDLLNEVESHVSIEDDDLKSVFKDIISSFYFDKQNDFFSESFSLLCFKPASQKKNDFGKFIVDVILDNTAKQSFESLLNRDTSPLDIIVSDSYASMKILEDISSKNSSGYTRIFVDELDPLFKLMNDDIKAAIEIRNNAKDVIEFVLTYYLFTYLSQVALRLDNDLNNRPNENSYAFFKMAKEPISEDRYCVSQGWKKIDRKTAKIFKHLIVLNMLNCHDNTTKYLTYGDLFNTYKNNPQLQKDMDEAVDYIIEQYTKVYEHDTDTPNVKVDFSSITLSYNEDSYENYKGKIKYLFDCVSLQLDSKGYRQNVVSYVASNYNHILKMRFVKSWGQYGHMLMLDNEDLIHMIRVCQLTSEHMDNQLGIQISDLFIEFEKRQLYFDGKTKQYIIDYLISRNLIDSKCDSEEAQYVKPIQ